MKLIVSTFLVYKVKKCLLKSGKVKEPHSTYCLTMAQYCPQLGQLFAIAGHKVMHREKNFGRSTIIRNMPSTAGNRGFAREKPYFRFYSSLFTD